MYKDISVQLVNLLYIIILSAVYFLKRKYNFLESKVYKLLLVSTSVSLILDIVSMCVLECGLFNRLVITIFTKLYFVSIFIWIVFFIFYILLNKTDIKYDNFKMLMKKSILCKSWLVISGLLFLILLFCKIDYNINPIKYYGNGVVLVYAFGVMGCLFLSFMLLLGSKNITSYKNCSMLFSIIVLCS